MAKRVLAVDAALRDLLKAAEGAGAVEEAGSAAAGAGAPIISPTFEALADKHFEGHEADLRQLCAEHVLFYNFGARTVEYESELMRRITASWLDKPLHTDGIELVEKLLAWQAARQAQAVARVSFVCSKGAVWLPWAVSAAAAEALDSADARVRQLDGEVLAIRKRLCQLPNRY